MLIENDIRENEPKTLSTNSHFYQIIRNEVELLNGIYNVELFKDQNYQL